MCFQVCLFNQSHSKDTDAQVYVDYALPYALKVLKASTELIEFCVQNQDKKTSASKTGRPLPIRGSLVSIFRQRIGELLPPILSSLWAMKFDAELASKVRIPFLFANP